MSRITLTVNRLAHTVDVDPQTPLLYVLSDDLALRGPKFGCGLGQCGSCTVIAGGRAIRSCVTPVGTMEGADITTLEGLGTPERPHPRVCTKRPAREAARAIEVEADPIPAPPNAQRSMHCRAMRA